MSDTVAQDIAEVHQVELHIRINYKSGNSFTGWFSEFNYTHSGGNIKSLTATHTDGQKLLIIGLEHIESIIKLETVKKAVDK